MADPTVKTETILDQLVAGKREILEQRLREDPIEALRERALASPLPLPFAPALRKRDVQVIAELKQASPAKGTLARQFDPCARARGYVQGGAAAISVLTEERRFLGSLDDLRAVRQTLDRDGGRPPLLRKDFLFDPYQLYEARAAGADAVLLIVCILNQSALTDLLPLASDLSLGVLVEVHDEDQVERALAAGAHVIGINNRDLRTFVTDLDVTRRLRPHVSADTVVVSESGIQSREDMESLASLGVDAVLIGEALMRRSDVVEGVHMFTGVARESAQATAAGQPE